MESAVGIIWRNIIKKDDDTNKHIAKILYKDYQNNIFRDIDELSKISNVSPATITNFCKKNGFTGYRQLKELLKFEYDRYKAQNIIGQENIEDFENFDRNKSISVHKEMFTNFIEDLYDYNDFINNFKENVLQHKKIVIFVGSQLSVATDFLINLLNKRDIFCKKILIGDVPFDNVKNYISDKKIPYLFIFTGEDNEIMYYIYENLIDSEYDKLFFITTTGQKSRIKEKEENVLVIKSKIKYFDTQYRKVAAEILFLIMFGNV